MRREKIIIFGPSWVGDMVMAKSLFTNLKKRNPLCEIHLIAPNWSVGLAEKFDEVDKVIKTSFAHGRLDLLKRLQLSIQLRKNKYDECIFLVNSFKSLFSIMFSAIPLRTGFDGEFRRFFLNNSYKNTKNPTVEKFVQLSASKNYKNPKIINPHLKFSKAQGISFLKVRKIPTKKLIIIAGGAEFGPAKILPLEKYGYIATKLLNNGLNILLVGSSNDQYVNNQINQFTNNRCYDITGQTSLSNIVDVIGLSSYFLSNDSGLMHIAAALNVNQESFFGSSDPKNTPPMNINAQINYLNLECSPCFKRNCPLGHFDCMNLINEKEIADRILCKIKK